MVEIEKSSSIKKTKVASGWTPMDFYLLVEKKGIGMVL